MVFPISGPSYIYGENMSVIYNTQCPDSTMSEKSNSIFHRSIRESIAMGESLTNHIRTNDNPSDLMTKFLTGQKRRNHIGKILYNIYYGHH